MDKENRYFARDGYPVKLVYNKEDERYDAYRIDTSTGEILYDFKYVGKVLGYSYPPGSDLYFDEITKEEYKKYISIIQKRAEKTLPFYCILDGKAIKVILEKSNYSDNLIRVIYYYDESNKEFKWLGNSFLEKVYGETSCSVTYISEEELNNYIRQLDINEM